MLVPSPFDVPSPTNAVDLYGNEMCAVGGNLQSRQRLGRPLLEKFAHILDQVIQIFLNDTPDDSIIDGIITVNENVPEGHNVTVVTDVAQKVRFITTNTVERLAHDLELAFHGTAQQLIGDVVFERPTCHELLDSFPCLNDIMHVREDIIFHRDESFR